MVHLEIISGRCRPYRGLADAPDAPDVAAVEIGGEAKFGVVGHLDWLIVGLEAVERRYRPEGTFSRAHVSSIA